MGCGGPRFCAGWRRCRCCGRCLSWSARPCWAANSLCLLFYSLFFEDRLLLDLFFTTVIVIVVGYPLGLIFIGQNVRLRTNGFGTRTGCRGSDDLTNLCNPPQFHGPDRRTDARGTGGWWGSTLYRRRTISSSSNDAHGHAGRRQRCCAGLGSLIAANVDEEQVAARGSAARNLPSTSCRAPTSRMHRHWPSRSGGTGARDVARGSAGCRMFYRQHRHRHAQARGGARIPDAGSRPASLQRQARGRDRVVHSFSGVA